MVTCFIGIGSNLGDRQYYINTAVKKIKTLPHTRVKGISTVIESLPEDGPGQSPYLNAVIKIETQLFPYPLLQELQNIESQLGRRRTIKNAARTIDLDILLYGDLCLNEEALRIPHPQALKRGFVFEPLKEIAPEMIKKTRLLLKKSARVKKLKTQLKAKKKTVSR